MKSEGFSKSPTTPKEFEKALVGKQVQENKEKFRKTSYSNNNIRSTHITPTPHSNSGDSNLTLSAPITPMSTAYDNGNEEVHSEDSVETIGKCNRHYICSYNINKCT